MTDDAKLQGALRDALEAALLEVKLLRAANATMLGALQIAHEFFNQDVPAFGPSPPDEPEDLDGMRALRDHLALMRSAIAIGESCERYNSELGAKP